VKGLKVPGGHIVNFSWEQGEVTKIEVVMGFAGRLTICMNGQNDMVIKGDVGERINWKS